MSLSDIFSLAMSSIQITKYSLFTMEYNTNILYIFGIYNLTHWGILQINATSGNKLLKYIIIIFLLYRLYRIRLFYIYINYNYIK